MTNSVAFPRSVILQALSISSTVSVFLTKTGAEDTLGPAVCPSFSCGHLQDIRPPFRRRGDPLECGVEAYELGCTSSKATIHINKGTYYVTAINYTVSYFWVMDPNFNTSSSCPLPLWNHLPYFGRYFGGYFGRYLGGIDSVSPPGFRYLATRSYDRACFANCSRAVMNKSAYKPVACLSAKNSHVYVWVSNYTYCAVEDLEPYCGYLAEIPFGNEYSSDHRQLQNASYADITQFISKGFTVQFPFYSEPSASELLRKNINLCLNNSIR